MMGLYLCCLLAGVATGIGISLVIIVFTVVVCVITQRSRALKTIGTNEHRKMIVAILSPLFEVGCSGVRLEHDKVV